MGAVPRSALRLTAEEMREAGYRTVDMLVRHLTDEEAPPIRRATVGEIQKLLVVEGDGSRELYIVPDGEAAITRGGANITTLGAGEPIGESAALEWGAGFGYARTATATATAASPERTLIIPAGGVRELVREMPVLGDRLRVIARSRLHRP